MISEAVKPSDSNDRPASFECLLGRVSQLEKLLHEAGYPGWIVQEAVERTVHTATDALISGQAQAIAPLARWPWLRTVALRNAATVAREARRRATETIPLDSLALRDCPLLAAASEQLRVALLAELPQLPEQLRQVVETYYWCEFSLRDSAELLDLSVAAIRKRLDQARKRLREALCDVAEELAWDF